MAAKRKSKAAPPAALPRAVLLAFGASVCLSVGFVAGRVAPDELGRLFPFGAGEASDDEVVIERVPVPRQTYTVDEEIDRRRDEARQAASGGEPVPTADSETEPLAPATAVVPQDAPAPAAAPQIGEVAADDDGASARTLSRVAHAPVDAPAEGGGRVPPTAPVVATQVEPERVLQARPAQRPEPSAAPPTAPAESQSEGGGVRVVRRGAPEGADVSAFEFAVAERMSGAEADALQSRLIGAGLNARIAGSDGVFRVVVSGQATAAEVERQRALAGRVAAGSL
jgi:hypothetical protein